MRNCFALLLSAMTGFVCWVFLSTGTAGLRRLATREEQIGSIKHNHNNCSTMPALGNDGDNKYCPHRLGIIHLGKTGGAALRATLTHRRAPRTKIQEKNPHWIHMEIPDPFLYDEWIALVRDPIERVKSEYIFEHPENSKYRTDSKMVLYENKRICKQKLYQCFYTIQQLALEGLATPTTKTTNFTSDEDAKHHDMCRGLVRRLFHGLDLSVAPLHGMAHMTFNFAAYYKRLLLARPNVTLWIVRQEHMLEDLNAIHDGMGGAETERLTQIRPFHHLTVHPDKLPVKSRYLSPPALENLCRALCSEIQIYKQIFRRAKNVNIHDFFDDKKSTVARKCKDQTYSNDCPDFIF